MLLNCPWLPPLCAQLLSGSASLALVGPDTQSTGCAASRALQPHQASAAATPTGGHTAIQNAEKLSEDILSVHYTPIRNTCPVRACKNSLFSFCVAPHYADIRQSVVVYGARGGLTAGCDLVGIALWDFIGQHLWDLFNSNRISSAPQSRATLPEYVTDIHTGREMPPKCQNRPPIIL